MDIKDFIAKLANELASKGRTMDSKQLASVLNANGFSTTYGDEYQGARGTSNVISSAYRNAMAQGDQISADNIATVFTNTAGETPWY